MRIDRRHLWASTLGVLFVVAIGLFLATQPAQASFLSPANYTPTTFTTTPPVGEVSTDPQDSEPLTIVTRVVAPFIVDETKDNVPAFTGYSKDLIDLIQYDLTKNGDAYGLTSAQKEAISKPLSMHTVDEPTAEGLIKYIEDGQAHAAIANISINNNREGRIDYSMPIFNSALQTMRLKDDAPGPNIFTAFGAILQRHEMHVLLLIATAFILLVANMVYLFERRHPKSPWYKERYLSGVFETAWWSITTLVGQEESHPRSGRSRMVAIGLMVFGVLFVSIFTASFASELTLQRIDDPNRGPQSLEGQTVITVRNSTSYAYLDRQRAHLSEIKTTNDIEDAYRMLKSGEGDAIVYDAPVLQHYADNKGKGDFVTVGSVFHPEYYGIALPKDSPWREPFNRAILSLSEAGELDKLRDVWLDRHSIYSAE